MPYPNVNSMDSFVWQYRKISIDTHKKKEKCDFNVSERSERLTSAGVLCAFL